MWDEVGEEGQALRRRLRQDRAGVRRLGRRPACPQRLLGHQGARQEVHAGDGGRDQRCVRRYHPPAGPGVRRGSAHRRHHHPGRAHAALPAGRSGLLQRPAGAQALLADVCGSRAAQLRRGRAVHARQLHRHQRPLRGASRDRLPEMVAHRRPGRPAGHRPLGGAALAALAPGLSQEAAGPGAGAAHPAIARQHAHASPRGTGPGEVRDRLQARAAHHAQHQLRHDPLGPRRGGGLLQGRLHGQLQHLPGRVGRAVRHRAARLQLPGAPRHQRRLDGQRLRRGLLVVPAAAAGGGAHRRAQAVGGSAAGAGRADRHDAGHQLGDERVVRVPRAASARVPTAPTRSRNSPTSGTSPGSATSSASSG